jgi:hypothetical protein
MVKLVLWLLFTLGMVYKPYTNTANRQNKIKQFNMDIEFDFKKFHKGYKDLMVQLHPDTSGYDSAEDFAEARRFYEVIKDKIEPEKIWEIYV